MNPNQPNPYAPPASTAPVQVDPVSMQKIEAIIKDAGQFWIAILMCIFCTGLGSVIIGPWYLVRLLQWNSLAQREPLLLDRTAPRGSVAQRFQAAKGKLIAGMVVGATIFLLAVVAMAVAVATAKHR